MSASISVPTMPLVYRVRLLDWFSNGMNGVADLPGFDVDGCRYVVRDDLVVDGPVVAGRQMRVHAGSEEGLDDIHPSNLCNPVRECRVLVVTETVEVTPQGDIPVAVPYLTFTHPARVQGGEVGEALDLAERMVRNRDYRMDVVTDFTAPAGSALAPVLPEVPSWQQLDVMTAGERPACEGVGGTPCGRPVEVAWRAQVVPARWTCAWHWPMQMGLAITPVVFAVWGAEGWVTWRHAGEWELFLLACESFAASVDAIPDRQTLPTEERSEVAATLYGLLDHNQSALLWAVAVCNSERNPQPLAQAVMAARGDGPYLPSQFCWVDVDELGMRLVAEGQERWAAGDVVGAARLWGAAANGAGNSIAMGRIAEVARAQGDLGIAIEWWTRSAMLGNVPSMTSLGATYSDAGDLERAAHWLERAASKGHSGAMFNLGVLAHRQGKVGAARFWFTKARDHGDADAADVLARLPKR